ncbi:MAG TPA: NAD-dependent epimerase/dehydratase family protein [Rhodanobacteraceae bacterium]|nr:NAD-dependent epimerase/dehydratase family protein [Rhodanobacteraceae bacterium]
MAPCLVFGASGAIGRFLVPRLLASGREVVAISRTPRTSAHPRLRWVMGELPDGVPALPADASILSAGPLDRFTEWLAARGATGSSRIVAVGSLSAVTKRDSDDAAERALAARLADSERRLFDAARSSGAPAILLRPTLIYGAGLDRNLTPIVRLARRWRVFPLVPEASGARQPVHADDVAAACVSALAANALAQDVYDLGGGERLAFATMLARVRASLPFATLALPVPLALARRAAGLVARLPAFGAASPSAIARLREDLVADHDAAMRDLGWMPRTFRPQAADWVPPSLP